MAVYRREYVAAHGWRPGTSLEDMVCRQLTHFAYRPEQQYRAGRFRLDFAWPDLKIALEADGWHHRSPEGAARDRQRDSWLRSEGWLVFRVDDEHGEAVLAEQISRVAQIVTALRKR
jgi:very-short-patch-repair endonuclease